MMKKLFSTLTVIILLVGCQKDNTIEKPETKTDCKATSYNYDYDNLNYELVWSDEFDYSGLPDDSKWGYDVGGKGWGNNELQYYTNGDNVTVNNGVLTIETRKEFKDGSDYTSTRLISKNKGDWKYGKLEVRAMLPSGKGTWPAIWMLPTNWRYGGWPHSGEIDIMEHVGFDMNHIHGTVHTSRYNHMKSTQQGGSLHLDDVSNEFHTYSIEWLPDKILFFIDGKQYNKFQPNISLLCPSSKEWPFDQEFHLLLNIAVGGNWGGAHGVDENIWPQTMEVDYVRVYQAEEITNIIQE